MSSRLTYLMSEDNVLTLLRQVVGTGGSLEKRCVDVSGACRYLFS